VLDQIAQAADDLVGAGVTKLEKPICITRSIDPDHPRKPSRAGRRDACCARLEGRSVPRLDV
jgi:hypothetical protein